MGGLAVLAFFGSGFSVKIPYGVNSLLCSVALLTDDIVNGVDETYMIVEEVPSWSGINDIILNAEDLINEITNAISDFPAGGVTYDVTPFDDCRDRITNGFPGNEVVNLGCAFNQPMCTSGDFNPPALNSTFLDSYQDILT